ncbi:MAG: spermidine/putrescine transport system permease protein [Candidatus Azotimanducaceae bacterium]|jgi:spermidine/putrescine transport system permease protein
MSTSNNVKKYPGFNFWTVCFFAFLYLPILVVILYSFNSSKLVSVWGGFSLKWYVSALNNNNLLDAVQVSLTVAIIATVISTTVALLAAMVLVRGKGVRFRKTSETIVSLPLLLPEIVVAVAILIFFSNLGIANGMLKLIIAHSTFCIPFAFLPIRARLQGMSMHVEEASEDLYANKWTTFKRITFPMILPGVSSGAMLAFVISMDDFITSSMLNSGGSTTLPVYIFSLIRQGVTPELNAISTLIIGVSLFLAGGAFLLQRQR